MKRLYAALLLLFCWQYPLLAQPASVPVGATTVSIRTLATGFDTPWEMLWGPDNQLWLTERLGRISRVNPETGEKTLLLTVPDVTENVESGLLGMALHPDFTASPYVYIVYNYTQDGLREKLVRYTYNGTTLINPQVLLENIPASPYHNGSRLIILPDLTMLMSTGDGNIDYEAQNIASPRGKILRLNLDGTIPADNPTAGSRVYTLGHRNPQGLVRAPSGRIYSSEHGPSNDDEVNLIEAGRNYGWPTVQGFCNLAAEATFCAANNVREPLYAWTPTIAVSGLTYYDHPAIPGWQNSLLLLSLKAGQLLQLPLNTAGDALTSAPNLVLNKEAGRLRAICVSPAGRVYVGTSNRDGSGSPAASDDRIMVLENLAYTPTATRQPAHAALDVWPNPAHEKLTISFPAPLARGTQLVLQDALGRTVRSEPLAAGNSTHTVSLKALQPGVYQALVKTSARLYRQRIVVQ
ncbi:PQQ-dependent sugar dehydrogenase [Hymenobacter guriensis]|uniref:PQQ-dependent sugar dehydrogenase n=1 Tax=Hymenobacter guriensis TaxID=2793065 RepID=A0ABS0KZW8_9BACT|nr:PQQ-dependent sugar dehydrogenase [Hymenobacter guriensis]MBG8553386.1 PQQ-dependent sugar dehydrogenase [Hymenobacter guriensis]